MAKLGIIVATMFVLLGCGSAAAVSTDSKCWSGYTAAGHFDLVVICENSGRTATSTFGAMDDRFSSPGFTEGVPTAVWQIDNAHGDCAGLQIEAKRWQPFGLRLVMDNNQGVTDEMYRRFAAYIHYAEGFAIELGCDWVT